MSKSTEYPAAPAADRRERKTVRRGPVRNGEPNGVFAAITSRNFTEARA